MTKEQLDIESKKPSTNWVQASSGDLGKLYLEVLGCDELPAMDGLNPRDKTDAFACIVYQDCIVTTDVISNTLSPRWMPWSHRAFAFNISHPSSDVLIGFFDHDPELSPLQLVQRATSTLHDPIGRLVINTENFAPGTLYTLQVRPNVMDPVLLFCLVNLIDFSSVSSLQWGTRTTSKEYKRNRYTSLALGIHGHSQSHDPRHATSGFRNGIRAKKHRFRSCPLYNERPC